MPFSSSKRILTAATASATAIGPLNGKEHLVNGLPGMMSGEATCTVSNAKVGASREWRATVASNSLAPRAELDHTTPAEVGAVLELANKRTPVVVNLKSRGGLQVFEAYDVS